MDSYGRERDQKKINLKAADSTGSAFVKGHFFVIEALFAFPFFAGLPADESNLPILYTTHGQGLKDLESGLLFWLCQNILVDLSNPFHQ